MLGIDTIRLTTQWSWDGSLRWRFAFIRVTWCLLMSYIFWQSHVFFHVLGFQFCVVYLIPFAFSLLFSSLELCDFGWMMKEWLAIMCPVETDPMIVATHRLFLSWSTSTRMATCSMVSNYQQWDFAVDECENRDVRTGRMGGNAVSAWTKRWRNWGRCGATDLLCHFSQRDSSYVCFFLRRPGMRDTYEKFFSG